MDRRRFIGEVALLAAAAPFCPTATLAQGGFAKPVRIIVPFDAGGIADMAIRLLAPRLTDALGEPIVLENRPGASGIVGAQAVAHADPDGQTVLFASRDVFGINPVLYKRLPYDAAKGLLPVGIAVEGPHVLVANPSLGAKSLRQLLDIAKSKAVRFGSAGAGSMSHLILEHFARQTGISLQHSPYEGARTAMYATAAGEVSLGVFAPTAVLELLRQRKLVGLAVGASKRLAMLPDVPALAELGLPPDALLPSFFALAAPGGTPEQVIAQLSAAFRQALTDRLVVDRLRGNGFIAVGGTPEEMRRTIEDDLSRFGALINELGIKPEEIR